MDAMTTRVALSPNDSLWLNMDTPQNLMIIESIMWFAEPLDLDAVKATLRERLLERYPVFTWRAERSDLGADHWVPDEQFDLDRHVIAHEVGDLDGHDAVQDYVAGLMSKPLPMDRPLWQAHVLTGPTVSVVVQRFHHAIADGTALVRVLLDMTTDTPEGDTLPPAEAASDDEHESADDVPHSLGVAQPAAGPTDPLREPVPATRPHPGLIDRTARRLSHVVTLPLAAGAAVARPAADLVHMLDPDREGSWISRLAEQALGTADAVDKLLVGTAPDALPFGRPGLGKRPDWAAPIPLADIKAIAKAHDATVNDVMLALLSGALRRYVIARGEVPVDVVTMIPVNLRPWDAPLPEHLGNKFALIALELPLAEPTAQARLRAAKARMDVVKQGPEAVLTFGLAHAIGTVGAVTARGSRQMTAFFGNKAFGVTTNVPGPERVRYFAGKEMVGILGWVPGASQQTLGACIFSYNGRISVGFKADTTVLPDVGNIVACFEAELADVTAELLPGRAQSPGPAGDRVTAPGRS